MDRWQGKRAVVTGAAGGIGAEICKTLAKRGLIVIGCGDNLAPIEKMATELEVDEAVKTNGGKLLPIRCNVRDEKEILTMFENIKKDHGDIGVCINNAGVIECASLISGEIDAWRKMMEVNVLAMCICTREALKIIEDKGVIIQMGCVGGHKTASIPKHVADVGVSFYNGTKSMVRALTEGLRQELKAKNSNIRVSTISPGPVETGMLKKVKSFVAADTENESEPDADPKDKGVKPESSPALPEEDQCLKPEEIVKEIIHILETPNHINMDDIVITNVAFRI